MRRHASLLVQPWLLSGGVGCYRYCATKGAAAATAGPSPAKLEEMSTFYSQLTLKELSELQRLIFAKLGYSEGFYEQALLRGLGGGGGGGTMTAAAAAPVGPTVAAEGEPAAPAEAPKEKKKVEKTSFDVKLAKYAPEIKVKLIKELRSVTNLSIMDAKTAIEKCPGLIAQSMGKDDAQKLKEAFEKLGATVELL